MGEIATLPGPVCDCGHNMGMGKRSVGEEVECPDCGVVWFKARVLLSDGSEIVGFDRRMCRGNYRSFRI